LATKKFIIITTINPISKGIKKLSTVTDYKLVVVGDKKTPQYKENNIIFLDVKKTRKFKIKICKNVSLQCLSTEEYWIFVCDKKWSRDNFRNR